MGGVEELSRQEYLQVKTKGGASPQGKPRVFFTCHPDDTDSSLERICGDIFRTHDCAVYYTPDMTAPIPETDRETDLDRMSLFVVPVTLRLLTGPSRAMDEDVPFAVRRNIPVLHIMLEPGLVPLYSAPDKFGRMQYLSVCGSDETAIQYGEKLTRYLQSVLISEEMVRKVRAAFDAYIFLSYRKKDRRYANELMRLIHSDPVCRDVAIWYDEFLVPGEDFSDAIKKALEKSQLFTLLVTPNLVNEKNYVQTTEYPEARRTGKPVLPAEMAETDHAALQEQYPGVPDCVDPHDEKAFRERLLESVRHLALRTNDGDPRHSFLIGLAYLDGIDVEVDRDRALELIKAAAEAELPEAMEKLADMYRNGVGVPLDYRKELPWRERLAAYYERTLGPDAPETVGALSWLARTQGDLGGYQEAVEIHEQAYDLTRSASPLGLAEHMELINLAAAYGDRGEYQKEVELLERAYAFWRRVQGERNPETLRTMSNLAAAYIKVGDYRKANELAERVYACRRETLGEEHPATLRIMGTLAGTYTRLGEREKALAMNERVYALRREVLGEEHPDTLTTMHNLACVYDSMNDYEKARELKERTYLLMCRVLGEEHPTTLTVLNGLAFTYSCMGEQDKALALYEQAYALRCKVLGEKHPDTVKSRRELDNMRKKQPEQG